jgi:hypothetical protein
MEIINLTHMTADSLRPPLLACKILLERYRIGADISIKAMQFKQRSALWSSLSAAGEILADAVV